MVIENPYSKSSIESWIVWEDDDFIFFNKPAGLLTQQAPDPRKPHLYGLAQTIRSELYLHHRLDAGTSGLLLMTKTRKFNSYVTQCFRDRRFTKKYWARSWLPKTAPASSPSGEIIHSSDFNYSADVTPRGDSRLSTEPRKFYRGEWIEDNYLKPIKPGKGVPTKMKVVQAGGQQAVTHFHFLGENLQEEWIEFSAEPKTGRMHQIRAHLAYRNLPILGDWLYGPPLMPKHSTLFLHSYEFGWTHPVSRQIVTVQAPCLWRQSL